MPYLTNLNEDPILSYVICNFLDAKQTKVGRSKDCQIQLNGLSIISEHAVITNNNGEISIEPGDVGAKIKVNGMPLEGSRVLEHSDRILFGSSHLHVFVDPRKAVNKEQRVTWELAQKELAEARGFALTRQKTTLTKGKLNLIIIKHSLVCLLKLFVVYLEEQNIQDQIVELLPTISDANAISEELNKYKMFEVVLVPAVAFETEKGQQHAHHASGQV
jgi:hypothetical protein